MAETTRLGDILANSITHGIGAILSCVGVAALVATAVTHRASRWCIASCAVFGASLILVYLCSTLYHSLVRTRARRVFRVLDHSAIYLLIAGTYTPFTLVCLRGKVGWLLFSTVWTLAVAGIVFKSLALGRLAAVSVAVYIIMGWLVVFAMRPMIAAVGWNGVLLLALGGAFYTAGILFFAFDHVPYFHAVWHLFVLGGSAAHYLAVLFYVIPTRS